MYSYMDLFMVFVICWSMDLCVCINYVYEHVTMHTELGKMADIKHNIM